MTIATVALATAITLSPAQTTEVAGIIAGETIPGLDLAHQMVACTIYNDLQNGYTTRTLRGRWYGWKAPQEEHYRAWERVRKGACGTLPNCLFLGSGQDYRLHWAHLPNPAIHISQNGFEMVCVERYGERIERATDSTAGRISQQPVAVMR